MARKGFRVRVGHISLKVFPYGDKWRFGYRGEGGRWRYVTRRTKAEITSEAEATIEGMAGGFTWARLRRDGQEVLAELWKAAGGDLGQIRAAIRYLEARRRSAAVGASVDRYIAHKEAEAGGWTPYVRGLSSILAGLKDSFPERSLADIDGAELTAWWQKRCTGVSGTRKSYIRTAIVGFWRWCRREGLVPDGMTVAERLPVVPKDKPTRRVLTRAELEGVLEEVAGEFRAWVVLGAWAGLRPEEIAPHSEARPGKRGLLCEEIDWDFRVIRVPEAVSKVGFPRVVPMSAVLCRALAWAGLGPGMTGPVCLRNPSEARETRRLGKKLFGGPWPKDVLRHSFGTYRNAVLRNLPQVAEEMGTSVAMLHRHYHNPAPEADGVDWFAEWVPISSDLDGGFWSSIEDELGKKRRESGENQRRASGE